VGDAVAAGVGAGPVSPLARFVIVQAFPLAFSFIVPVQ
jgi:hypothetical protein